MKNLLYVYASLLLMRTTILPLSHGARKHTNYGSARDIFLPYHTPLTKNTRRASRMKVGVLPRIPIHDFDIILEYKMLRVIYYVIFIEWRLQSAMVAMKMDTPFDECA